MSMNERPNNYRRVPYAEHEGTHLFKVLRHFPELAKTMPEVEQMQKEVGRNWEDQKKPGLEKPRQLQFRSTRRLESLKKSEYGVAGGQMNDMRKVLLASRNPVLARRLAEAEQTPYLENGSLSTNPTKSNTPAALGMGSPGGFTATIGVGGNGSIGLLEDGGRGPESKPNDMPGTETGGALTSTSMTSSFGTSSQARLDKYGNYINVDPLTSSNNKLAKASLSYAPTGQVNILQGFQGQDLTEEEFDVQLKRCLQVNLSKKELHAMFTAMDADGSGLIDGVEFTRYFLTVGNIARDKIRMAALEKQRREDHMLKMAKIEEHDRLKMWENSQVSVETNENDEERVFRKLALIALHWDNGATLSGAKLVGFDAYLTPFEFKQQLEASFELYLDKDEIGALMKRYKVSGHGDHCVDGKSFLQSFSKLRRTSREKHTKELKKYAKRKEKVLQMGKYFGQTSYSALGR